MICIPVTAATTAQAKADWREAAEVADLVELRLDYVRDLDLRALFADRPSKPVIATCRPRWEGGHFDGPEDRRLGILRDAAALGAEYLDVEAKTAAVPPLGRAKLVISHHDFAGTPADLAAVHAAIAARKPDVVKVVTTARSTADAVALCRLAAGGTGPRVVLGMGELGLPTRLLYRRLGCLWTYASLRPGAESAPGQILARDVRGLYRADRAGPRTRVFGVVGQPVGHSKSLLLFNAAFARLGIDAIYIPLLLQAIDDLPALVEAFDVEGMSVTIPHNEGVRRHLHETEPLAARIGAVNTVSVRGGRWFGSNSDLVGALEAIRLGAGRELRGKRAAVLGAGGAARAVVAGLVDGGADVFVVNRTASRAEALAREFGCRTAAADAIAALAPDVLVNATPVGMHPRVDESPVPASAFRPGMTAFDMVYNPPETRFLADARRAGAAAVSGVEMFIRQAAEQWRTWFGEPLDAGALEAWRRLAVG
jgi:3-dehydroquinate dehydratase/shikimate dehydrogenase